jgi:ribonuclease J
VDLSKSVKTKDSVFILPLGGLGEIGMNMMALIYKSRAVILDCGAMFPEMNGMGIDLVAPCTESLRELGVEVDGIVYTHAHEDHIGSGALLYQQLGSPDIYGTAFTLAMLEERMTGIRSFNKKKEHTIEPGKAFKVGAFKFHSLPVTHSIVDSVALKIETPQGIILHTGDFKIEDETYRGEGFNENEFAKLGSEGVDLLLSDSTNVESPGWTKSELDLGKDIKELIQSIDRGKLIVTLFSSNIPRIHSIVDAAKGSKRKLCLIGRSVTTNVGIARRLGFLDIDDSELIEMDEVDRLPPEEVLVICTGTQAEPRSALMRLSLETHSAFKLRAGDTVVFSSRQIPGNERRISGLMNNLHRIGCEVLTHRDAEVHVSGHARREELAKMMSLVNPKCFLPVHGEYRMLVRHHQLGKEQLPKAKHLLAENGDLLEFKSGHLEPIGKLEAGKQLFDENRYILEPELLRERKKLGFAGSVVVTAVIDSKRARLIEGPDVQIYGISENFDPVALEELLEDSLRIPKKKSRDLDSEYLEKEIRVHTRRFFKRHLGIKPIVFPVVYVI